MIHVNRIDCMSYSVLGGSTGATVNVNKPYKSLRTIIMGMYGSDYNSNTTYRKNSRMNGNVKYCLAKAGSKNIPDLPLECDSAGNNFGKNNSVFLTNIYKSMNNFTSIAKDSVINPANMCFNGLGTWTS